MFDETLKQLGQKTVEYNRRSEGRKLLDEIYKADAVSVEALDMGEQGRETKGVEAIRGKHDWWESAHEIHETTAEGPFFFGDDRFGVIFGMDVTNKGSGERQQGRELGIYTVADGKIVREEFFYDGD